jgi:outer membrane protein assembly factor BamB
VVDARTGAIKWQLPGVVPTGHPSIVDDTVLIRVGSFDGATVDPVVAVDLATGKELWRHSEPFPSGEQPHGGTFAGVPVADHTVVYADPYGNLSLLG